MFPSVLTVARHGKQWSVSADGEVIALADTRKAAASLAKSAAGILRDSGAATEVVVAPEPRSFRDG
jgi:hypothetical protein